MGFYSSPKELQNVYKVRILRTAFAYLSFIGYGYYLRHVHLWKTIYRTGLGNACSLRFLHTPNDYYLPYKEGEKVNTILVETKNYSIDTINITRCRLCKFKSQII